MRGYRRVLRWAAFPITNRKWAAPLSAVAVGFGLFIGVAVGPGTANTLATGAMQVVELPSFGNGAAKEEGEGHVTAHAPPAAKGASGSGTSASAIPSPSFAPLPFTESESPVPPLSEAPESKTESSPPEDEPEAEEDELEGLVVHVNKAAGSYVVAEQSGAITAVHASTAPRPGVEVEVPVRLLANGTYAEMGKRVRSGTGTRAKVSGIVTYVDPAPSSPSYVVSARGVSMLIHVAPDPAGLEVELPVAGSLVDVAVDLKEPEPVVPASSEAPVATDEQAQPPSGVSEPDNVPSSCLPDPTMPPAPSYMPSSVLWQRQLDDDGDPLAYGEFAAIVAAICPEAEEILLSADDMREGGKDVLFKVPPTIDVSRLRVGDSILATATRAEDGTLSLSGLANDDHTKSADDLKALQGDLRSP